ncbi:MAG: response regulator [Phycisphaerales bacterium]
MTDHMPAKARRTNVKAPAAAIATGDEHGQPITDQSTIRVLCVDDHAVLVDGLAARFAMERNIRIVGRLSSAAGLLDEVERSKPDLVLMDIEMPGPDIFEMAARMRDRYPDLRFVFLSAHIRDGYMAAAYKCGAWGYFAKSEEVDDIVDAIGRVARSSASTFVLTPKVRKHCMPPDSTSVRVRPRPLDEAAKEHEPVSTPLQSLTPREIDILRLIGKGLSRGEIAKELSRSPKTIDGHQERIAKKLGIDSRADLLRFAIREGLAEP